MRKNLEKMLESINLKKAEVIALAEDSEKIAEAEAAKEELIGMQKQFDILKDMYDQKDAEVAEKMAAKKEDAAIPGIIEVTKPVDPVHEFAQAARSGFKMNTDKGYNNETNGNEGGYTVPEDIQTKINEYKEAEFSLETLVDVEAVTTLSGRRTFQKRAQHTGFTLTAEGGAIGKKGGPQFEVLNYAVKKYAGYLPVTNELLADSDANITNVITGWIAKEDVATRNKLILEAIATKNATPFTKGLDDIKTAINVTLGQAFAGAVTIVTNDDGFNYLDQLKTKTGSNEYLLKPAQDQTNAMTYTLAIGAKVVSVAVVPNGILTTTDNKIPFIIGDFKEAIKLFDRQSVTILSSNIASAGDFNAYEQDMTLFRAIERLDVKVKDEAAFVNGYITAESNGDESNGDESNGNESNGNNG